MLLSHPARYYFIHFADWDLEVQAGEVTRPRSHSGHTVELELLTSAV